MFAQTARRVSVSTALLFALPCALAAQSTVANAAGIGTAATAGSPASVIDPSTTYYACYVPTSGTVYRIKTANTPATCTKSAHVEFSWSKEFAAETTMVTKQIVVTANSSPAAGAQCPFGTKLISGGHFLSGVSYSTGIPVIWASRPSDNGWYVGAANIGANAKEFTLIVNALCAK